MALTRPGFDGHYEGCSGEHDGSHCWSTDGGVVQHLNMT